MGHEVQDLRATEFDNMRPCLAVFRFLLTSSLFSFLSFDFFLFFFTFIPFVFSFFFGHLTYLHSLEIVLGKMKSRGKGVVRFETQGHFQDDD